MEDFDLERLGFSLRVINGGRDDGSGGYLRLTLDELAGFISVLRKAGAVIETGCGQPETVEPVTEAEAAGPPPVQAIGKPEVPPSSPPAIRVSRSELRRPNLR
jgi:hypothetical protein